MIMASPAIARDRLLVRTDRRLYCLQELAASPATVAPPSH